MKVLVLGGNGFLGSQLCRSAAIRGLTVTSLSRSGSPKLQGILPTWVSKVDWRQGDLLDPSSYRELLSNNDIVIHSVGALLDFNYKHLMNQGLCASVTGLASNFITKPASNDLNKINFLTAKKLCEVVSDYPNVKVLSYISASPVIPPVIFGIKYIASKRAAEQHILLSSHSESSNGIRRKSLIFRPGIMFSDNRPLASGIASGVALAGYVAPFCNMPTPLRVETVAEAVIQSSINAASCSSKQRSNIYEVNDILKLAK
ncbi:hypothetical protein DSO57_1009992 [Entomophthora muscae]|uniref:Uncharacterized protein n=1 Tax=Entomophthora muscae TaxID=34485 RepID=A0ACC2RLC3_9FUNG|nr:hypothetical protein DSO57_1009992 [Entomophthora muscae]